MFHYGRADAKGRVDRRGVSVGVWGVESALSRTQNTVHPARERDISSHKDSAPNKIGVCLVVCAIVIFLATVLLLAGCVIRHSNIFVWAGVGGRVVGAGGRAAGAGQGGGELGGGVVERWCGAGRGGRWVFFLL